MIFNVYRRAGREGRYRWIGKVCFEQYGALPFKKPPHVKQPGAYSKKSQEYKLVPQPEATDPNTSSKASRSSAGPGRSRPAAEAMLIALSNANSR